MEVITLASTFDDNKRQRNYKDGEIIKRLVRYAKPVKFQFLLGLILTMVIVFVDLLPTELTGVLTSILKGEADTSKSFIMSICSALNLSGTKTLLIFIISMYFLVIFIAAVVNYFCTMILQKAGQKIVYNVRAELFEHIENLSIAQINSQPVGRMVTRVTSDTNMLNELYSSIIVNLLRYIVTIIVVMVRFITISPTLALYIGIIAPILFGFTFVFKYFSRKVYRQVRGNISNVNSFLSENLSGMKVTQIFNQEEKKLKEFRMKNEQLKRSSIKEILIFGIFRPAIYVLYVVCQIIVLYNGANFVHIGKMTSEDFVKFYGYIGTFFNPIQQLADLFNTIQSAFASSERIFEMLDTKQDILDRPDAIDIDHFEGRIEFKNVWFAYHPDLWILKDVSFVVEPNQTCAFVGATGAGKTTILALIVRNYEIQKGEILIDGINVNQIKIESLRKHIGQMLQDVFLFSGTIRSNITLREEDKFTEEEIIEACKYVNANTFIDKLEGGFDYQVRERGNNFSSGQRQLLSFARTIVHKPNIMILDEATANIDTETEQLIQDSLEKMMNVGTMLIVAHRLSTVQHANKIIVLHKGEIMEMGTHQELLHKRGLYYNLYEIQYKHLEK